MTATTNYTAVSRRALDLEDYIDVARRHMAWIAGPAFAGMVISVCIAFSLANSYESTAWMQITPATISDELVKTTVNQQLFERIIQMQASIESRNTLSSIIQDPHLMLYPAERAKLPMDDVVEIMKKDVHIVINHDDPSSRHGASTFSISFSYPQRLKATATVQALVTKFEDENTVQQRDQQNVLKDFFGDELTSAKANLEKLNEELTKFRNDNPGRLPEQSQMNMANLTSLQSQANGIGDQLNRLSTDRVRLDAQRSTLQANLQLAESMAQEAPGSSLFGTPAARQNQEVQSLTSQLESGDLRLQQLLQQYKPGYRDIRDLQSQLQILKKRRDDLLANQEKDAVAEAAKPKQAAKKSNNYQAEQNKQNLQGQLDQTNALLHNNDFDRENKLKEQEKLNREIESYRSKLAATSSIEAKYEDLKREYASAALVYQETVRKKQLTAQNGDLIARHATEHLEVLDNPSTPSKPSSPNRWKIVGIGFGLSFMVGIAMAGIQEAKDTSLKNLKDVRAYTNLPVLSSIPLLENSMLVKRKKRITYLIWSAAIIVGILAVCISLFYYSTVIANS
jgi:uncharacterized protein involved in exopolysaccharide biosynthesis